MHVSVVIKAFKEDVKIAEAHSIHVHVHSIHVHVQSYVK